MEKTAPKSKSRKPKRVFSWVNPKLEVRKSPIEGKGIFAKAEIKKHDILIVMGGYMITTNDEINCKNNFLVHNAIDLHENYSISPLTENQKRMMPQHYINHSCNPNMGFWGQIFMVAKRKIIKGEEIVYDYATVMKNNRRCKNKFKMICRCNSKNCRKIITENDWKLQEVQKVNKGYFQYFIQVNIDKNKKNAI